MASDPQAVKQAALREMARRELARRQASQQPAETPLVRPPAPSFFQGLDQQMKGGFEVGANLATGAIGGLGGGLTYLGTLIGSGGNTAAAKAVQEDTQRALTYQPRTQVGQNPSRMAGAASEWLGPKEGAYVGEKTAELTGSPALGAAANVGTNVAINLLLGWAAKKGLGAIEDRMNAPPPTGGGPDAGAAAVTPPTMTAGSSPQLQSAVTKLSGKGRQINNDVLARKVEADSLPVKITLTEGQATRDPVILSNERNMRANQPEFAQHFNRQEQQIVQNLQQARDTAGPNVFSTNAVEHGDTLIAAYKAKDAVAESGIKRLYDQLRDESGSRVPIDAKAILQSATEKLHEKLLYDDAPGPVMTSLKRLAEGRNMTFENFEALRTNLARVQRSAQDGNTRAAAGVIRSAMEDLPLMPGSGAARLKPIADAARQAARERFSALEADPAYKAAVTDAVAPDRFVQKFVINAPRDAVATMRANLAGNEPALQTMGVSAIDHLRQNAGVDVLGNGRLSQARFNKNLEAISPKLADLVTPDVAETLQKIGNVARYIQEQPAGSFVNNSNTFTAAAGNAAMKTAEGVANVAAGGVPVGSFGRFILEKTLAGKKAKNALSPEAGLDYQNSLPRTP